MNKKENKPKSINIDEIDLDRLKLQVTSIPKLIKMAHSRGGASIHIDDPEVIRNEAIMAMHEQVGEEIEQVLRQLMPLIDKVDKINERVKLSEVIYMSQMNFTPIVGEFYYLYQREDGSSLLSIVSPKEWGEKHPYEEFEGKVELLPDMTWKIHKS